jgi:hypothetical protein
MDNGLHGTEMAMSTNESDFRPSELAVVVPTFNERGNVTALFRPLETAPSGIAWEAFKLTMTRATERWTNSRTSAGRMVPCAISTGSAVGASPRP